MGVTPWDAYHRTTYRVFEGDSEIDIRIGGAPPALDRLLANRGAATWAFVTAWNPGSNELPSAENRARQRELTDTVERHGWPALPGVGIGDDGAWPAEESLLVLGIPRDRALALARRFGQAAIVFGERGGVAELVSVPAR
jgi:hypothetical protein